MVILNLSKPINARTVRRECHNVFILNPYEFILKYELIYTVNSR